MEVERPHYLKTMSKKSVYFNSERRPWPDRPIGMFGDDECCEDEIVPGGECPDLCDVLGSIDPQEAADAWLCLPESVREFFLENYCEECPICPECPEIPECLPLNWQLYNTTPALLLTGSVIDPCNKGIIITAPDSFVLRDGAPYGSVASGEFINVVSAACPPVPLFCDVVTDSIVVESAATLNAIFKDGLTDTVYTYAGEGPPGFPYYTNGIYTIGWDGNRWILGYPGGVLASTIEIQAYPWNAVWPPGFTVVQEYEDKLLATALVECLDEDQRQAVIDSLELPPCEDAIVLPSSGVGIPILVVPSGASVNLQKTYIPYINKLGVGTSLLGSNTIAGYGGIRPTYVVPTRTLMDTNNVSLGSSYAFDLKDIQDNTVPKIPAGDPIIYAFGRSLWSGQTISYRLGDEGTMLTDGFFDHVFTVGLNSKIQRLVNHYTLLHNNVHGNTNRFTSRSGGAVGGATTKFMRDHLTGIEYYMVPWSTSTWNDMVDSGLAINGILGETGWYSCPIRALFSLNEYPVPSAWSVSPFNMPTPRTLWSTTTSSTTANAWGVRSTDQQSSQVSKVTLTNMIAGLYCRKFF